MENEETQEIVLDNDEVIIPEETTEDPVEEDTTDYKAEALKWKAIATRNKGKSEKPLTKPPKIEDDLARDVQELKLSEKKRQFGYSNDLSPEETDRLFRYAGDQDPKEALKDPFFQAGLRSFRDQKKVEDAIPSGSNKSSKVDGKTFKEMTSEERAKNWGKIIKKS